MISTSQDIETKPSLCPSKVLWGVRCMGCGLGKSIGYLEHGDIRRSIIHHPLGWAVLVAIIVLFFKWLFIAVGYPLKLPNTQLIITAYVLAVALAVVHVYRLFLDITEQGLSIGRNGLFYKAISFIFNQVNSLLEN